MKGSGSTRRGTPWVQAILLALAVLSAGCDWKEAADAGSGPDTAALAAQPEEVPHWVHRAQPNHRVAVVFVHGLFGTISGTWNNPDGTGFFKFLHEQPGIGGRVDIFAFGFTSHMFADGSLDIREAANKLEGSLSHHRVWDYDSVVFVGHSMGGLVILRELIARPQRREKVPLVVLYATPVHGADIANLGKLVSRNPALGNLVPADGNALLQQLSDDWKLIPAEQRPRVVCAYEKRDTYGVRIVTWSNAVPLCDGAAEGIGDADHITIAKPVSADRDAMIVLFNALEQYVLGRSPTGFLETPDFRDENGEWVLELTNPNGETPAKLVNTGDRGLLYTVSRLSDQNLLVLPDPTPKVIAARAQDQLRVFLTREAALDKEYRFILSTPTMGDRVVKVRIPDPAVIEAARMDIANAVAGGMAQYLSSQENLAAFQQAGEEGRATIAAQVAMASVARVVPDVPQQAQWVITADTLVAAGMPDFARKALDNAEFDAAAAANARVVQRLDNAILEYKVPDEPPPPASSDARSNRLPRTDVVAPESARDWALVSEKMQTVPALQPEALALKGDVLRSQGRDQAAQGAYQQAAQLKPSPALTSKANMRRAAIP